jgi:hypothetical protein
MALRSSGNPPALFTEGPQVNPTNTLLMADTGAVSGGNYEIRFIFTQTANAAWNIQHRNVANDASTVAMRVDAGAGQASEFSLLFRLAPSERVRVTNNGGFTGTGQVLMQTERMD